MSVQPIRRHVMAQPFAELIDVTPEIAAEWLTHNTKNRPLKPTISAFARDMAAGDWRITGEAIKFGSDPDQTLLDGQNRLHAVVKSGVTVPMFVIWNVEPEAQAVMDTGVKRSAADMLHLSGKKQGALIAAATRIALSQELGYRDADGFSPTHSEIAEWVHHHPEIEGAAVYAHSIYQRVGCQPSVICYTLWRLSQIDRDDAARFWNDAAEKVGLPAGDPVIALLNRFSEIRQRNARVSKPVLLSAIYRAWNARRDGRPLKIIRANSPKGGLVRIPEPR